MLRKISRVASRNLVAGALLSVAALCPSLRAAENLDDAARRLLADVLVEDARTKSRDTTIPASLAIRQTSALLQAAAQLDPANTTTLRLLAEAARVAKQPDIRRDALRQTIKADPGNLVAQVQYLELIALASQTVDDRIRVYTSALNNTKLDPQVRSEMAVRLAALNFERGGLDDSKALLATALQLNDLNVTALQDLIKIAVASKAPALEQLNAHINALLVSPYQPDSWIAGSRILARANLHDAAADWLIVGIEQLALSGTQAPAETYFDLAMELALANRRSEAEPLFRQITNLADAPLPVLLAAQTFGLTPPIVPPADPNAKTETQPASQPASLQQRIREKLAETLTDPANTAAIGNALTVELLRLPDSPADIQTRIDAFRKLVPANDTALVRVEGLAVLRAKKYEEAKLKLASISEKDLVAQIAFAAAQLELKQTEDARKILQDIWSSHPTGLNALTVVQLARKAGITLTDTQLSKDYTAIAKRLPASAFTAHRHPRDLVLVTAQLPKARFALGEPILLTVKESNTSDRALPVGPNGVVKTSIGIAGATRGMGNVALGMFAFDDDHRTYRLERRAAITQNVRVDQGLLADLFRQNPLRSFPVSMSLLTAPRGNAKEFAPGLGGVVVPTGDFDRTALPLRTLEDVLKSANALSSLPPEQQLRQVYLLSTVLTGIPEPNEATPKAEATNLATARSTLTSAILPFAQNPSVIVRAYLVRMAPRLGLTSDLNAALDVPPAASPNASPAELLAARFMYAQRVTATGEILGGQSRATAIDTLTKYASTETDPLAKSWIDMQLEELNLAGSKTAPGTVKEQTPDVGAATQSYRTRSDKPVTPPVATQPAGN